MKISVKAAPSAERTLHQGLAKAAPRPSEIDLMLSSLPNSYQNLTLWSVMLGLARGICKKEMLGEGLA